MDESVIDQAVYAELQNTTGAKFVTELVFIEEGPGMLAELRAARAEGNAERFRRAAHSLKSNGRTFGAVKLTALAREFELKGLMLIQPATWPAWRRWKRNTPVPLLN